ALCRRASHQPQDHAEMPPHDQSIRQHQEFSPTSWSGKEPDRTDARVRRQVSLQALDELSGGTTAIELRKHLAEVRHRLLRCHSDELLGAKGLAHAQGNTKLG